ncbi:MULTISPECIES: LuxR C-terminal-related transcriptional regulator [unclassified Streptomyces]|uniref:LuxR C-terminal-related transcriptional regulator n=1 Tax=Streptomyces sp. NPDC127532 TaxID=3345399 RepID=UPI00362910B8
MIASPVTKIVLAPREREVLEGLAAGDTLAEVAGGLDIRKTTAAGYLLLAKKKLYGARDTAAAVAVGFAVEAITQPPLLDPVKRHLLREQRALVAFIARGLGPAQMAREQNRPVTDVRADGRELLKSLQARNRPHLITRAWQFQILTAGQVTSWLR